MNDSRDRILACACDLFLKHGLDGFSMRKVAREVGVTAPALYRHFEGREELLLEVLGEGYKLMSQYLYSALSGETPLERFRLAGDAYLDFALENPRYYSVMYSLPEFLGTGVACATEELAAAGAVRQFWNDRVRECMDAGILRPDDTEAVGLVLWSHSFGLISIYTRGLMADMDEASFRLLFRASTWRILAGLGTERLQQSGAPEDLGGSGSRSKPSAVSDGVET